MSTEDFSSTSSADPTTSSSGRRLSLLDCISVEKEKAWAGRCEEVYQVIDKGLVELRDLFAEVRNGMQAIGEECKPGTLDRSDELEQHVNAIDTQAAPQRLDLDQLKASHLSAYEEIERIVASATCAQPSEGGSVDSASADDGLRQLVDNFEEQYRIHESVLLSSMNSRVTECTNAKELIVETRSNYLKFMYKILQKSAEVQTFIHKLKKRIEFMAKLYKGHNEYFAHLRSVSNLPDIYNSFLLEIVCRRQFTSRYDEHISRVTSEVNEMRRVEILRREGYIRKFGSDLPQLFFAIVPSIKEKPPFFNPSVTASQRLPELDVNDLPGEMAEEMAATVLQHPTTSDSGRVLELEEENARLRREIDAMRLAAEEKQTAGSFPAPAPASPAEPVTVRSRSCMVLRSDSNNSNRDFSLGAAMSALSSVVQLIQSNTIVKIPHPASTVSSGFLSVGNENTLCDIESVVDLIKKYISGVEGHIEGLQLLLASCRDEQDVLSAQNRLSSQDDQFSVGLSGCAESPTEPKISFRKFSVGDIALFCPVNSGKDVYIAFNLACPFRYLSPASLNSFREGAKEGKNR